MPNIVSIADYRNTMSGADNYRMRVFAMHLTNLIDRAQYSSDDESPSASDDESPIVAPVAISAAEMRERRLKALTAKSITAIKSESCVDTMVAIASNEEKASGELTIDDKICDTAVVASTVPDLLQTSDEIIDDMTTIADGKNSDCCEETPQLYEANLESDAELSSSSSSSSSSSPSRNIAPTKSTHNETVKLLFGLNFYALMVGFLIWFIAY